VSDTYKLTFEHKLTLKLTEFELAAEESSSERFKAFLIDTSGMGEGDYLLSIEPSISDEIYFYRAQIWSAVSEPVSYEREDNQARYYER